VRVIVNCLVRFDALLVVAEDIFKDWDYLSNSTKATAFTASFKTLCSSFQRLQRVYILGDNRLVSSRKAI
jgi:hypothetical protein